MNNGDRVPDVALSDAAGASFSLATVATPLVVFFFPKADTPGCTREAADFSALAARFAAAGTTVIGVSKDDPARLAKFAAKHGLGVRLASDGDGTACAAFGVWGEKQLYGRRFMGIERATFLFDAAGRLAESWRKVRVAGHAESVADAAEALQRPV